MTRVHDMGGRLGDGSVVPEPQGIPELKQDWQARALALTLATGSLGRWNIDMSRHARECLSPQDYARFSYFEKWIAALADLLVQTDVLTCEDLTGSTAASHPLADRKLTRDAVAAVLAKGGPADRRSDIAPHFSVGQAVRARRPAGNRLVPGGHSRLPAYAAGACGHIHRIHGAHVLPDSNAHGLGEAPEPLYAVRFAASELWRDPEHPDDQVVLDLWQSYLLPL